MKINRVHLENYRVHENLDIEFSKGINLLLGENGKGKSSILEAIGIALFGSKPRTVLDEAVTFGKKSGKIEINFTGIDGEEYLISKRIPNGASKLSRVSDGITIEGKADKIKELCGIKGEIKNIYDNIIVAKQNEFVSAFKDTANNRETTFNAIFNTDIYKKIGEKDLLNIYRNYEKLLGIESAKYESISARILNPEELKEELKEEEDKRKEFISKIALHTKEEEIINSQLEKLKELEIQREKLLGTHKNILNNIENCEVNSKKIDKLIEEAMLSEQIVAENKEGYNRYNLLSQELENKKRDKKEIDTRKLEYEKKEKEKAKNQGVISKIQGDIEVYKNKIENNRNISLEKETLAGDLEFTIKGKQKDEIEYQKEIKRVRSLITQCLEYENEIINREREIVSWKTSIEDKKDAVINKEKMVSEIEKENITEKLSQLEKLDERKKYLENRNGILITQKNENITAYDMLKSYQCPYLKESCENLKGKDINLFFREKISNIEKEYDKNIHEITEIKNKLAEKKSLEEKNYKASIFKKEIEKSRYELLHEEEHYKTLETSFALTSSNYENFKLKNSFESRDELQKKNSTLAFQLENLNLKKDIEELGKLKHVITSLDKEIAVYSDEKEKIEQKVDRLKKENTEIEMFLENNKSVLEEFISISKEIEDREDNLKSLEVSRNLYIENYKKSLEKEKYIVDRENNNNNLALQKKNLEVITKELEENKISIASYDKESLIINGKRLKDILGSLREELGKSNTQIKFLTSRLEDTYKDEKELKTLEQKIKKLKIKLDLTQKFRDNVKAMGKEVSKNMLKEIEIIATDNFRKITGRGERIVWSNEDKDKYTVYLVNDASRLKFEQLSGGEQVAVAISIRSAMSNLFTDSKFSIFDEPTNNLDKEKKQSLADSIGEILKNLEQSIIVTHDDTFQEMAEKVIYL